jgi:hypothetical protein
MITNLTQAFDKYPRLKTLVPPIKDGRMVIQMNDLTSMCDEEFRCFILMPYNYIVSKKILQYIGDRMNSLSIEHTKKVDEKSIITNLN